MLTPEALGALITLGVLCVISTTIFLVVRTKIGGVWGMLTKLIASLFFVALGVSGCFYTGNLKIGLFIVLGLMFGMIGDILLDLKVIYKQHDRIYLNAGTLSFACGHIMYFIAAIFYTKQNPSLSPYMYKFLLISLAIAFVFSLVLMLTSGKLKINFGKFIYQSFFYSCILSFMTAFTICIGILSPIFFLFASGIALILVSDLVLSLMYFGGKENSNLLCVANHTLYYMGQIVIAISIFVTLL